MTIALETEVIASSYDKRTRVHSYTIERLGRQWTVSIPESEFQKHGVLVGAQAGVNKLRRRVHLASALSDAMQGPPDAR